MRTKATKTFTILLSRDNLLYDIKNCAYVEGDTMSAEDDHARHQVFDIGEDGNVDRVTRTMDIAYAECVEFMYPYAKKACKDSQVINNDLVEQSQYEINLTVGDNFSQSTVELLAKLVHEYIVCRVLGDWLRITDPNNRSDWDAKAEETKNAIRVRLNARINRVRRSQTPF